MWRVAAAQKLQTRERELKQINQTLEQRVTARTRELSNANRDLEDIARVAAHDLRQPLRVDATLPRKEVEGWSADGAGRAHAAR